MANRESEYLDWFKVYRSILEWEWFTDSKMVHLYIYLLARASYRARTERGRRIERGQLVTSRARITDETGLSNQEIRTCLDKMKSTGEITVEATNRFSVITICNYDKYQPTPEHEQPTKNQLKTNKQPTNNQPSREEYKEREEYVVEEARARGKFFEVVEGVGAEAFMSIFFDPCRQASLEQLCMSLHTDMAGLRAVAKAVLAEWEVTMTPPHQNFKKASYHLVNQMRIKINDNQKQNNNGKKDNRRGTPPPDIDPADYPDHL